MVPVFTRGLSPVTFRDIGRDRNGGTTHLRRKTPLFIRRELRCYSVDSLDQIHASPPNKKIFVAADLLHALNLYNNPAAETSPCSCLVPHAYCLVICDRDSCSGLTLDKIPS